MKSQNTGRFVEMCCCFYSNACKLFNFLLQDAKAVTGKSLSAKVKSGKASAKVPRSSKKKKPKDSCSDGRTGDYTKKKSCGSSSSMSRKLHSGGSEREQERRSHAQSSRRSKTRSGKRDAELLSRDSARSSFQHRRLSTGASRRGEEATVNRSRFLSSKHSHTSSSLRSPSTRSFLASGATLSGTIDGIQRELIRRYIHSARSSEGKSSGSSFHSLPKAKSAMAQVRMHLYNLKKIIRKRTLKTFMH